MKDWHALINTNTPVWSGVEGYADDRIAELTRTCCDLAMSIEEIRAAQAGIAEMERLKGMPDTLRTMAEASKGKARKEY